MATGYYLEDNPNRTGPAQYGWPRTRVSGVIGVHTTESGVVFTGPDLGAENTARFISGRADHGSYHSLADWDTRIKLTRPTFAAWADTTNNRHAMSVSGAMNAARWRDLDPERAAAIVRNMGVAAAELVQDAMDHGVLDTPPPAQRISAAEAIAGTRAGFYGHGETNPGTRYDPGTNFDWDLFLASYASALGGGITYQGTTQEDDVGHVDTISDAAAAKIAQHMLNVDYTTSEGKEGKPLWVLQSLPAILAENRELTADAVWGKHFTDDNGNLILPRWVLQSFHNLMADQRQRTAEIAARLVAETVTAGSGLDADAAYKLISEKLDKALGGLEATITLGAKDMPNG